MTRQRISLLLSSALLAALAPACGAVVDTRPSDDGGTKEDAASDTASDTVTDTSPPDTGRCTPVADNTMCGEMVTYPCGLPIKLANPGAPTTDECKQLCAPIKYTYTNPVIYCSTSPTEGGAGALVRCASCAVGRKPGDLLDDDGECDGEDPVGRALAEMARVEAASVHAFRRLERTLGELGAEPSLRARARRAAREEITHARSAARLANKRGARPRRVRVSNAVPSTFDLALENAVEGCVHETLGVAYLAHQRQFATDPELAAHAAAIHDDELEHAALSWDLVAFFDGHLTDEQRKELRAARDRALDDVIAESARIHPVVRTALGLPSRDVVAKMVGTLRETLFA